MACHSTDVSFYSYLVEHSCSSTNFRISPGTTQPHDAMAFFFTKPHAVNTKVEALVVSFNNEAIVHLFQNFRRFVEKLPPAL